LAGVDADVTEESEYQSQIVKHSRSAGLFVATVDRNRRYYYTPYKVKGMQATLFCLKKQTNKRTINRCNKL
jgi:hypothetical protein